MIKALNREGESMASHYSRANLKDVIHRPNTGESPTFAEYILRQRFGWSYECIEGSGLQKQMSQVQKESQKIRLLLSKKKTASTKKKNTKRPRAA